MALIDLKRVTDLFTEGVEIVFKDDPEDPIVLWMNKLNSFETEECRREGAAARARFVLALEDRDSPDGQVFEARLQEMDRAEVLDQLMQLKQGELLSETLIEVQADPEWKDRREILARSPEDLPEDEKRTVEKLAVEYNDHVEELTASKVAQARADLSRDSALNQEYRKRWREARASDRFTTAYTRTQIFYGLRLCQAKRAVAGSTIWDHSECRHPRALASINEVIELPALLIEQAMAALGELSMSRGDARFLGGRPSSSGSSAQPAPVEESTASTPEVTSPGPATISSPQSPKP